MYIICNFVHKSHYQQQHYIMKIIRVAIIALMSVTSAWAKPSATSIIPEPAEIIEIGESRFALQRNAGIAVSDTSLAFEAQYLADYTDRYLGIPLNTGTATGKPAISLINRNNGEVSGGYHMTIDADSGVRIEGNDAAGVFYGIQTLIQLLPTRAGVLPELPELSITDYPRFTYRGMHLDVARHFFPVDFIKKYIDYLALHKLNYFHWHLTDDQGWRIEIKCYPELTETGSRREGEILGLYPGKYQEMPYGGYYTQDQVRDVIKYAADRHITVVPEIDIPGHCMAVLAAFPHFSTTPDEPKKCALTWGIFNKFNNVLAPTPEVFEFLTNVFTEICDLFPGEYIHTGGDECAKKWWQESKSTQKFMRKHNLEDEKALQSYFIHHVRDIVTSKGKTLIGWEEVLQGGIQPDCVVMNWRRPSTGREAIRSGHRTIFSCSEWSYFNIKESRLQPEIGALGRAPLSMEKVYGYQIVPDSLTAEQKKLVMGAQGCIWTEYIPATWKAEVFLLPRLSALAENVWTPEEKKSWESFARKVERQAERYDLWGARYNEAFFRTADISRSR